ncbi:TKL protein kinase [Saprolegnia diclina VS20]|uniref:TKL protein kinase n=1 Tax=Saprolegnia diclina (strain VS20) TaxID=1156394 RepID=T0QIZ8_SAPDV|nr:TKL protein kinase [Saprolegnia diclina VS20]EQC33725.1 TKL protein kinase [Saprolegnia diclina VS20]|eukprot:XP_008612948.1 TKL protein kinase [Saprolegnia diclina VS20]
MDPFDPTRLTSTGKSATAVIWFPFQEVRDGTYDDKKVHIYMLPLSLCKGDAMKTLLRMSSIMPQAKHPNVLEFVGIGSDGENAFMVTEATEPGTLRLRLEQSSHVDVCASIKILLGVAKGMCFLHEKFILHRTLTAATIHVTSTGEAKVGNFEFAREDVILGVMTNVGVPTHAAPEILSGDTIYTAMVDVYSYAMLIVEVVTRHQPYANVEAPQAKIMEFIVQHNYRPVFLRTSEWPAALFELMEKCWDANPVLRPSFKEIVECLEAILAADAPKTRTQ